MLRSNNLRKVARDQVSEALGMSHPDGALRATGVRHIYLIVEEFNIPWTFHLIKEVD